MSIASLNTVKLMGRLAADPNVKQLQKMLVASFTLAIEESYKDSSGNFKSVTNWVPVQCFGRTAEAAQKNLRKGFRVMVNGKLKNKCFEKDGTKHYVLEFIASDFVYIDLPSKNGKTAEENNFGCMSQPSANVNGNSYCPPSYGQQFNAMPPQPAVQNTAYQQWNSQVQPTEQYLNPFSQNGF